MDRHRVPVLPPVNVIAFPATYTSVIKPQDSFYRQNLLRFAQKAVFRAHDDLLKLERAQTDYGDCIVKNAEMLKQIADNRKAQSTASTLAKMAMKLEVAYRNNALNLRDNAATSQKLALWNGFLSLAYLAMTVSNIMDVIANCMGGPAKEITNLKKTAISAGSSISETVVKAQSGKAGAGDAVRTALDVQQLTLVGLKAAIGLEAPGTKGVKINTEALDKILELGYKLLELGEGLAEIFNDFTNDADLDKAKSKLQGWAEKLVNLVKELPKLVKEVKAIIKTYKELKASKGKYLEPFKKADTAPDLEAALDSAEEAFKSLCQMVSSAQEAWQSWSNAAATDALADRMLAGQGGGNLKLSVKALASATTKDLPKAMWGVDSAEDARLYTQNLGMQAMQLKRDTPKLQQLHDQNVVRIGGLAGEIRKCLAQLRRTDSELKSLRTSLAAQLTDGAYQPATGQYPAGWTSVETDIAFKTLRLIDHERQLIAALVDGKIGPQGAAGLIKPELTELRSDMEGQEREAVEKMRQRPRPTTDQLFTSDQAYEKQREKERAKEAAKEIAEYMNEVSGPDNKRLEYAMQKYQQRVARDAAYWAERGK